MDTPATAMRALSSIASTDRHASVETLRRLMKLLCDNNFTADIDECLDESVINSTCHQCVNTPGSYRCICNEGYAPAEDLLSCTGKYMAMFMKTLSYIFIGIIDVDERNGTRGIDFHADCHRCVNLVPGYSCECDAGFILDNATKDSKCAGKTAHVMLWIG